MTLKSVNKQVWEIINEPIPEGASKSLTQTRLDRLEAAAKLLASQIDVLMNEFN